MKRLAVMSIYSESGMIDDSVEFFLKSLKSVITDMVIIINGTIDKESGRRLGRYTTDIRCRINEGYDIGAYADFFEKLQIDELDGYDELILVNDTCFGPFVSFPEIFKCMQNKDGDFWGLNYVDIGCASHLQSYFLVYKKKVFAELRAYLLSIKSELKLKEDAVAKFEHGFFAYLLSKGYSYAYYTSTGAMNIYEYPDVAIEKYHLPILKKRCFDSRYGKYIKWDKLKRAITQISDYDIDMIREVVCTKYNFDFKRQGIEKPEICERIPMVTSEDMRDFLQNNPEVYLYGAGHFGKVIVSMYKAFGNIVGIAVSENHKHDDKMYGIPIYEISEIEDRNTPIIVALSKGNTDQVREKLSNYKKVLYLWE